MKISNKGWNLLQHDCDSAAARCCGEHLARQLRDLLGKQDRVTLFLSGGNAPAPVFEHLAHSEMDWHRVDIHLVDERFAPGNPTDLNASLIQRHLLHYYARQAHFHPLLSDATLEYCLARANLQTNAITTPDVVLLGMGLDGHTASLFPDAPEYGSALASPSHYVLVHPGSAPYPRISMSGAWLKTATYLTLYIPGQRKWEAFCHFVLEEQALSPLPQLLDQHPAVTIIATGGQSDDAPHHS